MGDEASLTIEGTVQRSFEGPKVTKVSIKCNLERTTYVDIVAFKRLKKLSKGDRVRVTGHIGSEKSGQEANPKTGVVYDKWIPMLIADEVMVLEPGQREIPNTRVQHPPGDDVPF